MVTSLGAGADTWLQRHRPHPAAALAGRGRGRLRRRPQAGLAQVAGVGEAGGLPDHHPDPGAPVAPRGQVLDPAVVQPGGRAAPVLGEHLGELAARAQGDAQHCLDHRFVDQRRTPVCIGTPALEQVRVPAYRENPCPSSSAPAAKPSWS